MPPGANLPWLCHVNATPDLPPGVYRLFSGFEVKYQQIKQFSGKGGGFFLHIFNYIKILFHFSRNFSFKY